MCFPGCLGWKPRAILPKRITLKIRNQGKPSVKARYDAVRPLDFGAGRMNFTPSPRQILLLWNLMFTGREPMISRLEPPLNPAQRRELEKAGLIELEQRGRARHVVLTDKAWVWAAEHLDAEIMASKFAVGALAGLLKMLDRHLKRHRIALGAFAAEGEIDGIEPEPESGTAGETLEERIRSAYLNVSGGGFNVRIRLAQLKSNLADVPADSLAEALIRMQKTGRHGLVLWPLDDPRDIFPEDEAAAVNVAGVRRHIVYMESGD